MTAPLVVALTMAILLVLTGAAYAALRVYGARTTESDHPGDDTGDHGADRPQLRH